VPTPRACRVSFTDTEGIAHAVEVEASTLYEAATLTIAEFPAMRIHRERARAGHAAHGKRERARHVARGPVGQGRALDSERREAE
jgi:hypothetical protein